jgi:hypothetical protein
LAFLRLIVWRIFLPSFTLRNTASLFTRSVQLIFSILLQHRIYKIFINWKIGNISNIRYLWIAKYKIWGIFKDITPSVRLLSIKYTGCLKRLPALRGYSTHLNEQKSPSQRMSRNNCLLRYERCSSDLYSRCSMWFPCISTQLPALRRTEERILLTIPGFTWIPWQAFSLLVTAIPWSHWSVLNTPKSLGVPTAKNPED